MALPDLVASLTAKTDGFETALKRAVDAAEKSGQGIKHSLDGVKESVESVKHGLEALAGAFLIEKVVDFVKQTIEAADHLDKLSQRTGIAVETLGGIGFAAKQSGVDLDTASAGFVKLDRAIADAAGGGAQSTEVFSKLGISIRDSSGNVKDANTILVEAANKFEGYEDGANKTAIALKLFGKAGAELIPLLNQGGAKIQENVGYFQKYSGVTADLARKASEFTDTQEKLRLLSGAFGNYLAAEFLPTLQSLADKLADAKEKGDQFRSVAQDIAGALRAVASTATYVVEFVERLGRGIGFLAAKTGALIDKAKEAPQSSDILGNDTFRDAPATVTTGQRNAAAASAALDEAAADDDKRLTARYQGLRDAINAAEVAKKNAGRFDDDYYRSGSGGRNKPQAPTLNSNAGSAADIDNDKKALDQRLKLLDTFVQMERDQLTHRDEYLSLYYEQDNIAVSDYYRSRKVSQDEFLVATKKDYADEIDALTQYIAAKSKSNDPKEQGKVIEAQTRLIEVRQKLSKVEDDAADRSVKDWFAQTKAVEQYQDKISALRAQVLTLEHDTATAFAITDEQQNRGQRKQLSATRDSDTTSDAEKAAARAALQDLDTLRQRGIATAQLNDLDTKRNSILGDLQNQQDRVNLAVSTGSIGELEGLAQSSALNRSRIAALQEVVEKYDAIAKATNDPSALVQADALRVQLEKLAQQTDLVADKFRQIGQDAFTSFFDKLTSGTVKARDAFKALFTDLNQQISHLASQEISSALFSKDGFVGKNLSSLFSSFGSGSKGASNDPQYQGFLAKLGIAGDGKSALPDAASGAAGALTGLRSAGNQLAPIFDSLREAADQAAAALERIGGTTDSGGTNVGSLFGSGSSGSGTADLGTDGYDEALGAYNFARGAAFLNGTETPFGRGDIFSQPSAFPMSGGRRGVMGEAGPEAIVPLRRMRGGGLGVATAGDAGPTYVTNNNVNVQAPATRDLRSARQYGDNIRRSLAA